MTASETLKLIAKQWCNLSDLMELEYIDDTTVIKATDSIIPIIVTIVLFLFNLRFFIVNLLSKFIIIPPI